MTPLAMIAEWRKGCSVAGPASLDPKSSPADCFECTEGLAAALEKVLPELELKARLFDLLNTLEDVEWSGTREGQGNGPHSSGPGPLFAACPVCHGLKEPNGHFIADAVGHQEGCELERVLKEARR